MKATSIVAGLALWGAGTVQAFSQSDVHFWIGEGSKKCVVVLDWYGEAKAWGYQWDGTCPDLLEVVRRITFYDHRLAMGVQKMTDSYYDLYFFGYDVKDCACQWDKENGASSDPSALVGLEDREWYSQWWVLYGPMNGTEFPTTPQYSSWYAANAQIPEDGDWFVFAIGSPEYDENWNESPAALTEPTAAESPYGYEVVDSQSSAKAMYAKPENVLGRPTCYMGGQWGGPVSPYNPAWMANELFSLEDEEDFITIKFDHDVVDDPANPWGLDFIVFGNSLATGSSTEYYTQTTDPSKVSFVGRGASEPGLVEVSQDGRTWYAYANGPYADDIHPTNGLMYDPAHPQTDLFSGNAWWGLWTDPTYPVDPSVKWSDYNGLTLAQIAQRYGRSAGGTGFDLAKLDLPVNADGRKWIRYVRIRPLYDEDEEEYTTPDIDAVADVSPVSGYQNWRLANYTSWADAANDAVSGAEAIAANGKPNAVNYLLGCTPTATTALDLAISAFRPGETFHELELRTAAPLAPSSGLVAKVGKTLAGPWTPEIPSYQGCRLEDGVYVHTLRVSNSGNFVKLAFQE